MQNLTMSDVHSTMLQAAATVPIERPSVLIVDDEEAIVALLGRFLTKNGYSVESTTDTERAMMLLKTRAFDVLISDMNMPLMNGDQLLRAAKHVHPDIVAVMITAAADARLAVQCMKNGAYDYITKPFDLDDVALRIAAGIEFCRSQRENRAYRKQLEDRVKEQAKRLKDLMLESLSALTQALEAKDESTSEHSDRVTNIAMAIGARMQPDDEEFARILSLGANLHDIGKIGIAGRILLKPDKLTPDEMAIIERHPLIGVKILASLLHEENGILEVVRNHHERWDGKGYPDKLAGEEIPLAARIVAVADSYDAMVSKRAYRSAIDHDVVIDIIRTGAGSQWDPAVVDAFLSIRMNTASAIQESSELAREAARKMAA